MQRRGSIRITTAHIEKKLQDLCECGFEIISPYSCEDILRVFEKMVDEGDLDVDSDSVEVETDTLEATLLLLGEDYRESDYEYGRCYCENLLFEEFETYNGYETYLDVVERMVKITRGTLKLDNLKSWYSEPESGEDGENGRIWISFEFLGKKYEFSYEFKKWFDDVGLLVPIIKLLEIVDPTKTFAYYDFGERDAIVCIGKEDLFKLEKRKIRFKLLENKYGVVFEKYKDYTGQYEISEDSSITVTIEYGNLFVKMKDKPKLMIRSISGKAFRTRKGDITFTFEKNEEGSKGLLLGQSNKQIWAKKVRELF